MARGWRTAEPLVERSRELDRLGEAVGSARTGSGAVLLLEAPAGLGKTRLLAAARAIADDAGVATLAARASEIQGDLPFGVVRQLFEPRLARMDEAQRRQLFAGAAVLAEPLVGGAMPLPPAPDTGPAVLHGLYWLLANLADAEPLLLTVDDLQWADTPSLRFLASLVGRVDELAVAVVLGTRPPEEVATDASLVAHIAADPAVPVLRPQPLTPAGVAEVTRGRFADAADAFVAACHEVTAGNPFFLTELLDDVQRSGAPATAAEADRIRGIGPRAVSRAVVARLAALPAGAAQLAQAVAVLDDDAGLAAAAALAGIEPARAVELADALVRASILRRREGLGFVHPIVRSAVYEQLGPQARAALHARAAELLAGAGAEPSRVALHVLACPPAGKVERVAVLRAAALGAAARGAPDVAARLLRRALSEPPPVAERAAVLLEAGTAEALAAEPISVEHLTSAIAEGAGTPVGIAATLTLARLFVFTDNIEAAVQILQEAVTQVPDDDPQTAVIVEAELVNTAQLRTTTAASALERLPVLTRRIAAASGPPQREGLSCLACLQLVRGAPVEEVVALAERALDGGELVEHAGPLAPTAYLAVIALIFSDRYVQARAALDALQDVAQRRGSADGFATALAFRSHLHYREGGLADAEADARQSLDTGSPMSISAYLAAPFLADAVLERGAVTEAAALLASRELHPDAAGFFSHLLHTRARVRLAEGQLEEALADILDCSRRLTSRTANPAPVPWRSTAAEILLRQGRADEARTYAVEELELARRHGAARAVGIALHAVGRCTPGDAGLEALQEAVAVLASSRSRLEHARALVSLGAALRHARRPTDARDPLRRGMDLAHRCGATALADHARDELMAAGARPRRPAVTGVESLTASERRVAQLAAAGLSNPLIAQALFVTRKTVEKHLAGAYAKLGIESRAALADLLPKQ